MPPSTEWTTADSACVRLVGDLTVTIRRLQLRGGGGLELKGFEEIAVGRHREGGSVDDGSLRGNLSLWSHNSHKVPSKAHGFVPFHVLPHVGT